MELEKRLPIDDIEKIHYWLVEKMRVVSSMQFCVLCELYSRTTADPKLSCTFFSLKEALRKKCNRECYRKEEDKRSSLGASSVNHSLRVLEDKGFLIGYSEYKGAVVRVPFELTELTSMYFENLPRLKREAIRDVIMLKVVTILKTSGEKAILFVKEKKDTPYKEYGMLGDYYRPEKGDDDHIDTAKRIAKKFNLSFKLGREETLARRAAISPLEKGVPGVIHFWVGKYKGGQPHPEYEPLWLTKRQIERGQIGEISLQIRKSSKDTALKNLISGFPRH